MEVPCHEGFPEDSMVPPFHVFFSSRCLPGAVGGFGDSCGSEGSPLLWTGLNKKEGHSIIECMLPDTDTVSAFYFSSVDPFLPSSRWCAKS